jgi:hypothetical protein
MYCSAKVFGINAASFGSGSVAVMDTTFDWP